MDFSWTAEQDELYSHIVQFTRETLSSQERESTPYWTKKQWRACSGPGLPGLCVPQHYGGKGFDAQTTALAMEAFGYGCEDMSLVFSVAAHLFACTMPIVEYGSQEVKNAVLPRLCSGEAIGANAITEKNAGSDVFALQTQAVRADDGYMLTGTKTYVSNGPVADVFVIYATTNAAHGYLGISCFLVERTTPGLIVGEPFPKMGLTGTPACQVVLDQCRIPVSNRLGREGQGASIFKQSMHWERTCLFAAYIGQMKRQLEQTIAYTRARSQFGKPIGKNQAVAHRVADMKLRLEAAALLLYRACWLLDQKRHTALDISLAKLAVSEAAVQGGLDALRIHGARGFNPEAGIERMLRDAIPSTIFSGTSEMQRTIIASELGL